MAILFLFLALVFCFKELYSAITLTSDSICYAEDFSEDGNPIGEQDDSDEKSESDLLFSVLNGQAFDPALVAVVHFNSYEESNFSSPFFEIHIPPPEIA